LRARLNRKSSPDKAAESDRIVQLWQQAWQDTHGGLNSPKQPW